jgi:hypothetical protein
MRALVRDPAKAAKLCQAVDVIKGNFSKFKTFAAAFAGRTELLSSPPGVSWSSWNTTPFTSGEKTLCQAFSEARDRIKLLLL